jgi:hypothetical protein
MDSLFFPAVSGHAYAWIGEVIAHAKPRQKPRRGSGRRRGPQRPDRVGVKAR